MIVILKHIENEIKQEERWLKVLNRFFALILDVRRYGIWKRFAPSNVPEPDNKPCTRHLCPYLIPNIQIDTCTFLLAPKYKTLDGNEQNLHLKPLLFFMNGKKHIQKSQMEKENTRVLVRNRWWQIFASTWQKLATHAHWSLNIPMLPISLQHLGHIKSQESTTTS